MRVQKLYSASLQGFRSLWELLILKRGDLMYLLPQGRNTDNCKLWRVLSENHSSRPRSSASSMEELKSLMHTPFTELWLCQVVLVLISIVWSVWLLLSFLFVCALTLFVFSFSNCKFIHILFLQIARLAFKGTKELNRIQSVVFDTAYNSNQNLLICAPTGAGKTNIAMLAVLHELKQHLAQGVIKKDEFKVSFWPWDMFKVSFWPWDKFKVNLWPWGINIMHELKQHLVQGFMKKDEFKVSLWPWETDITMLEFSLSLWPWETNIGMLAILQELKQHLVRGVIKEDEFKVRLSNLTVRKKPTVLCS